MKQLIKQTENAKAAIKRIFAAEKLNLSTLENKKWEQSNIIRDKIHKLESEKYELEQKFNGEMEALKNDNKAKVGPLQEVCNQHKKVVEFMRIKKAAKVLPELKANNRGKEIILLDNPTTNQYINVYAYVYQNSKPKNKYSLAIVAVSIFSPEMLGYRWGSIQPYFEGHCPRAFEFDVKDAPTKNELIEFYNKKGGNSFWNVAQFEATVKEYEAVLSECNTPEWEREYLLSQKDYYENNYSRGTETPEYKAIIKQLKKFSQLEPV